MSDETTGIPIPPGDLPGFWRPVDKAVLALTKTTAFVVGASFTIIVAVEVASRYVFNASLSESNGLARFLLVWFFMLGAGLALRQGGHVGLDSLSRRLPRAYATALFFAAQLLMFVFFLEMIWGSYLGLVASRTQIEGSLGITLAWVMSAFPVGFILLTYHQAVLVTTEIRRLTAGSAVAP